MRNHFLRAATSSVDPAWNLDYVSFNGTPFNKFDVSAQETSPSGLTFKSDGTKMYVVGQSYDRVRQYDLSTAWDVTTATYTGKSIYVYSQESAPQGVTFKPDGTKMYVIGSSSDSIHEYDLSTAWDISTATYANNAGYVGSQTSSPGDLFFKPDGTKVYVPDFGAVRILEYSLTTAWDVSTITYNSKYYGVVSYEASPRGVFFRDNGTTMFTIGSSGDEVNEFSLSTAWDVTTASHVQNFYIAPLEYSPQSLFFKDDGSRLYVAGDVAFDGVIQFDLSTAWDISTAAWTPPTTDYFSVKAQVSTPSGLFFKPDGTKMYVLDDSAGDDVNEYSLSTAWAVETASYVQNFSVSSQDALPTGLFFKPDGTKMYVTGIQNDRVYEYSLSSAWDISTASFVQHKYVGTEDSTPQDVFFKDDGTKMFMLGGSNAKVNEYSLSTAWDISTASYVQNGSVSTYFSTRGFFFKDDGTKLFAVSNSYNNVTEFSLSTAWDASTISYSGRYFPVKKYESACYNLAFKPDGTKMFITGTNSDAVWAFDLAV